jgi:hypothetical protein
MRLHDRIIASYNALRKSSRIIKDYVFDLYYPIHRLSWRDRLRCSPLLIFIEYMVYQVDSIAENSRNVDLDKKKNDDYEALTAYKAKFIRLLQWLNSYNSFVEREIEMGEQYLRLENKVTANQQIEHSDVMRIAELRPSDVRLLHCLLFSLLRKPCDEELLSLLWPVEVIADIGNDFSHYADDVAHGRYNTYAMFVKLYREKAPDRIRSAIETYENLFLERLARFPPDRRAELMSLCARRYRAHSAIVPDPILNS